MGQMYDSGSKMYGDKGFDNENLLKTVLKMEGHALRRKSRGDFF